MLLRPAQNVPHSSFEAQEKQLVGPREVPWPSKRDAFESCAAEGCEVLRPSKAAAELLKLLRPAQNVPHSSFEAQEKQLVGPREVPWPSKPDAFESSAAEGCEVLRPSKAAAELLKLLNAFKACPKHAT